MTEQLEITYRARGSRPSVDLDLHLTSDNQAEVFIGSSTTLPVGRVSRIGAFAGPAPTSDLDAIRAHIAKHHLLDHPGNSGHIAPSTPNRYLKLTLGGQTAEFKIGEGTDNKAITTFEHLLHQLAWTMTEQPLRAVEATLDLDTSNNQTVPTLELRSIGTEPMTVLLVDPEKPVFTLYIQVELQGTKTLPNGVSFPISAGTVEFPIETVQSMAASGELPSGISELPPGVTYQFALPALPSPDDVDAVTATGSFSFWLPDGLARRALTLLTPSVAVPT